MKSFVIVIDTQRDFMAADGALSVAGARDLIPSATDFLTRLRPEEVAGVLFTYDTHERGVYEASAEGAEFPLHCVRDSEGWRNVLDPAAIDPSIPVWRLEKGVFDMWAEADAQIVPESGGPGCPRDAFFERLRAEGVECVTVIGVAADYCVKWALEGLLARGFAVSVPGHLTRGIARQIEEVAADDFAGARLTIERAPALAG